MDLEPCAHPSATQGGEYFGSGEVFGVDELVDTHAEEVLGVLRLHELVVVDSRYSAFRSETLGYGAGYDVCSLKWGYGYEQVATLHSGIAEHVERCRRAAFGHQIVVGIDDGKAVGVVVDKRYVLLLAREEFGEVRAYFTGSDYDDFHLLAVLALRAASVMARVIAGVSMPQRVWSCAGVPCGMNLSGMPSRVTGMLLLKKGIPVKTEKVFRPVRQRRTHGR